MIKRKKQNPTAEKAKTGTEPVKQRQELNNPGVQWKENIKYIRRTFPGPPKVSVPLRVAIDREAFVKVTGHVMQSIDEEICGVLVGEVCQDDDGFFVHVRNMIKGTAAQHGGAHVTFTHETWNQVHNRLETDFPGFDILGWYHSHPGFGVSFSEMDLFIQRNFFPSPTQFALVMDPLGGEKALCVNTPEGVQYIDRFWVDGREYRAFQVETQGPGGSLNAANPQMDESLKMIETRLNQVLHTLDKLNLNIFRTLTVMGAVFFTVIIFLALNSIFINSQKSSQPPELVQYVPVPVKIRDKEALIGVGIVGWNIPPEISAYFKQMQEKPGEKEAKELEKTKKDKKNWFQSVIDWIKGLFKKTPKKDADKDSSASQNKELNPTGGDKQ